MTTDNSKRIEVAREKLTEMTTGHVRVIYGHPVTRWAIDAFEIDSWGRGAYWTLQAAAEFLAS